MIRRENAQTLISTRHPKASLVIGFDWGMDCHVLHIHQLASGQRVTKRVFNQPAAVLEAFEAFQLAHTAGEILVLIEQCKAPCRKVIASLPGVVLYTVPTTSVAKLRGAFSPAGPKDDAGDARCLADILLTHIGMCTLERPKDDLSEALAMLVSRRLACRHEYFRQIMSLTSAVKLGFPVITKLFSTLDSTMALEFLAAYPCQQRAQQASPEALTAFFKKHGASPHKLAERLTLIAESTPWPMTPMVMTAHVAEIASRLAAINGARRSLDILADHIARFFDQHPKAHICRSLPGAGTEIEPAFVAIIGGHESQFDRAADLHQYTGIAPVIRASGKTHKVCFRTARPKDIHQWFYNYANSSWKYSKWARAYFQREIKRLGKDAYHSIIRKLAYMWQRIIFACWKANQAYDEERYITQLKAKGSPLYHDIVGMAA